jgi:hypothetical protein
MSLIPCQEILKSGKPCGKTPTRRCDAMVAEGRLGKNIQGFHLCEEHEVGNFGDGNAAIPRIVEDWFITQRRDEE